MVKVTLGICALIEKRGVIQLIKDGFKEGIDEVILVTPNKQLIKEVEYLFQKFNSIKIVCENNRRGKAKAINEVLKHSSGDIILMASADIKIKSGSMRRLIEKIVEEDNIGAVDSCAVLLNSEKNFFTKIVNFTWLLHNFTMTQLDNEDRLGHVAGDLYALRRGIINEVPENIVNDDAFIAMMVKLKGYKVLHESEAICYILGPENPYDYILQRSRILYGHFQIFKTFKKYPTTLEFTAIEKTSTAINVIKTAIKRCGIKIIFYIFIASMLESLAALYFLTSPVLKKNIPTKWKIVSTTKTNFI